MISLCLRKNSRRKVMAGKPDEERNYRALIEDTEKPPALEMVKVIAESLESVFK